MNIESTEQEESQYESEQTAISEVLVKLAEITKAASPGRYVFRGEPKYYEEVSSGLYRVFKERLGPTGFDGFDIDIVQSEILEDAERYVGKMDSSDLLSQLQHFGHPTNLIDFTPDYLIALFFACDGEPNEDARIILLEADAAPIYRMETPVNRIKSQKSIFVEPPTGVVTPDRVIRIPKAMKRPLIAYLNNLHDITTTTIYDDIHGYIKNANIHRSAYTEFHVSSQLLKQHKYTESLEHLNRSIALNGSNPASYGNRGYLYLMLEQYNETIQDLTHAATLGFEDPMLYMNRGRAYVGVDRLKEAKKDFDQAIELEPDSSGAFKARGHVYLLQEEWEHARLDFETAIELDPDDSFCHERQGFSNWRLGNTEMAMKDFDVAIDLDPTAANSYFWRALVNLGLLEPANAIRDLDTCIELDGAMRADAHFTRGIANIFLWKFCEARLDIKTSLDLRTDSGGPMFEDRRHVKGLIECLESIEGVPEDLLEMLNSVK